MPPSPHHDRLSALRDRSAVDLAGLLGRVPALAEALDGHGPLGPHPAVRAAAVSRADRTLEHLAVLLASPRGIAMTVASLTAFETRLLVLAAFHGGRLSREQAVAEAGPSRALDQAAAVLADLLLAHPLDAHGEWLVLRPGVARAAPFPGIRVVEAFEHVSHADLDVLLDLLGVDEVPYRHEERRQAIAARMRDPAVVAALRAEMPESVERIFDLVVRHGPTPLADLGIAEFDPWDRQPGPLHWLTSRGLVGVDLAEGIVHVWLDLLVGARGRLFDDWQPDPPAVVPAALREPPPAVPDVVARLHRLLDRWAAEPPEALKSGGLGVRPVRATAKALGLAPGAVGLLVHLAVELGLLGRAEQGWAPTAAADAFRRRPATEQWATLVTAWLTDEWLDEAHGLPERWDDDPAAPRRSLARRAWLDLLASLPEGEGLTADDLVALAGWRVPALLPEAVARGLLEAARILGVVPDHGPVGLTRPARTLLDGGLDGLDALLPAPSREVIVQADHTVIAPPDLDPDVSARLAACAVLESDAGARTWRLTGDSIARALAHGWTADELLAFLDAHSRTPVPGNVRATVTDTARRHGRLRAGTIASYLRSDDPSLVAAAAAVKGARLRVLAPTVAVSPLRRDRLVALLRERGVLAVAEHADGAVVTPHRATGEPLPGTGSRAVPPPAAALLDPLAVAEELLGVRGPTAGGGA